MMQSPAPICLSLKQISKDYTVRVLNEVNFELRAGEIHALLGANGAGKSTLCKIISGLTHASEGEMFCDGVAYSPRDKQQAEIHGVQIVQQELNLISTLSVAENLLMSRMPRRWGVIDRKRLRQTAREILDRFGMSHLDANRLAGSLGIGQQQMIEIAGALNRECKVLILDEPTAALSAGESEHLFEWLATLRKQGTGIIYVSHRLDEISRIADRATVLRDGCKVGTYNVNELSTDNMVSLMMGESAAPVAKQKKQSDQIRQSESETENNKEKIPDKIALRVESLTRLPFVKNVSFSVRAGECFGIAGLVGSGRTELLRAIFGADRSERGDIYLDGDKGPFRFRSPCDAVRHGIAMVTEDRKENGLLLSQSIRFNTSLCTLQHYAGPLGIIRQTEERVDAQRMRQELDIRCNDIEQPVETLSGGNQQKVAVSKWLLTRANLFLFDEPTRGIDVAAREKIHRLLATLTSQGKSIVLVSSDLDELFETCDRIGVLSAGKLVETYSRDQWSTDIVMQAAFSEYLDRSSG